MKVRTRRNRESKWAMGRRFSIPGNHKKPGENPRPQALSFADEIHHRAEAMTPVLKEILEMSS